MDIDFSFDEEVCPMASQYFAMTSLLLHTNIYLIFVVTNDRNIIYDRKIINTTTLGHYGNNRP